MMTALWKIRDKIRQFQAANSGAAAVEFALILPIMLMVYIGTTEASALIMMDRKIQSVAGAVGDLVARSDGTISKTTLTDYFAAASGIMNPYDSDQVKQVVTEVYVDSSGNAKVIWSRQYSGAGYAVGTDHAVNSAYPLPDAFIAISKGKYVIAADAQYSYKPLYGIVFDKAVNLNRENYFIPRFEGSITLTE